MKITLTKKIAALLCISVLSSLMSVLYFYSYIRTTRTEAHFVSVAGRQRMLSAEIRDWAHMVSIGQDDDRAGLAARIELFDTSLTALRKGGKVLDRNIDPAPAEVQQKLDAVAHLWGDLKPDLTVITTARVHTPIFRNAYARSKSKIGDLNTLSNEVVLAYEEYATALKRQVLAVLVAVSVFLACVFLVGLWLTRRYIVQPVLGLETAARRIGAGDFSGRLTITTRDELASLAHSFNEMVGKVQGLLQIQKSFKLLVDYSPEAIAIHREGCFVYVNSALLSVLKYDTPEELIGRQVFEIVHPDDREGVAIRIGRMIETGHPASPHEEKFLRRDGSIVVAEVVGMPIVFNGAPAFAVLARDVTERRKLQQQLIQSSKMIALGEMAGGIAHEVNNPLAVIHGKADRLMERIRNGLAREEEIIEALQRIDSMAIRISKIVQALRTISRDAERDPTEVVSLRALIEDVISLCAERFKNHEVEIRLDSISESFAVEGRRVDISQAVLNLLSNAHDAVSKLPEKWISISASDLGSKIEISITDSGSGIAPDLQKKLFSPFFTTKDIGKGTGLGLSISLALVQRNSGTLVYDSSSSNTRFVIVIPKGVSALE